MGHQVIGQGSSLWWNVANLAGVAESATVLGQINFHQRSARDLKLTALTVAHPIGKQKGWHASVANNPTMGAAIAQ